MGGDTYGYVRVSTQEQNAARQLAAMREFGVAEKNIIVEKQSGKDFCRPLYQRLVKGLRAATDFEKEFQMALINRKLNPELDTMFLTSRQNFTYLSSSIVKEMALYHVPLTDFVPAEIADEVQERVDAARRT